ncbi:hypothetical protein LZ554_006356 [Drepanopeziza brunnea f. sp. 'monogermtubi']|nr:hypothetical protein LZ554_006356 [Drepanopeziza brunnea f. sp. 'monogermtubi']
MMIMITFIMMIHLRHLSRVHRRDVHGHHLAEPLYAATSPHRSRDERRTRTASLDRRRRRGKVLQHLDEGLGERGRVAAAGATAVAVTRDEELGRAAFRIPSEQEGEAEGDGSAGVAAVQED